MIARIQKKKLGMMYLSALVITAFIFFAIPVSANMNAAKKWVEKEFQPSTLSKAPRSAINALPPETSSPGVPITRMRPPKLSTASRAATPAPAAPAKAVHATIFSLRRAWPGTREGKSSHERSLLIVASGAVLGSTPRCHLLPNSFGNWAFRSCWVCWWACSENMPPQRQGCGPFP